MKKKQKIYLDMNIYEDCFGDRDLVIKADVETLKNSHINYYYSPAHIEELAAILREEEDEDKALRYIYDKMVYISDLSENFEFLPSHSSIITTIEHPNECFMRVIKDYDATLFAEENEKFIFSVKNQETLKQYYGEDETLNIETFNDIRKKFDINQRALGEVSPELLFDSQNIRDTFDYIMGHYSLSIDDLPKWVDIKESHPKIEHLIGSLYNFLEKIGYKAEPMKKLRSRMHDVSHGIYATEADILVTGDNNFYKKTKAIYNLLEAPTLVLDKEEFHTYVTKKDR